MRAVRHNFALPVRLGEIVILFAVRLGDVVRNMKPHVGTVLKIVRALAEEHARNKYVQELWG